MLKDLVHREDGGVRHRREFTHVPGARGLEQKGVENLGHAATEQAADVSLEAGWWVFHKIDRARQFEIETAARVPVGDALLL